MYVWSEAKSSGCLGFSIFSGNVAKSSLGIEQKQGHKFAFHKATLLILLDYLFIHSLNKYILTTFYLPHAALG